MHPIPLTVVRVPVEQTKFDPGAVDAQIYCINTSDTPLLITIKGESFITIDEETGETADESSVKKEFALAPEGVQLIAEIKGWEWDGHVGMEISCKTVHSQTTQTNRYDFKSGSGDYFIAPLRLQGRIIPPL